MGMQQFTHACNAARSVKPVLGYLILNVLHVRLAISFNKPLYVYLHVQFKLTKTLLTIFVSLAKVHAILALGVLPVNVLLALQEDSFI